MPWRATVLALARILDRFDYFDGDAASVRAVRFCEEEVSRVQRRDR